MGKRKIGFKKAKNDVANMRSAVSSDDDDEIETHLESILDDEIDQYNSFKEKSLLDKGKKANRGKSKPGDSDEEEEVYGLDMSSDEDEEEMDDEQLLGGSSEEEDNDEDILGEERDGDGIPDSRAWGKKARTYHNTDYVDKDFGGFEGSDAEMAEQEEAEAKEIQKRLTAEIDESDILGLVPTISTKSKKADKEVLKVDFDGMSISEKRKLIQRQCPEVVHLLDEYKGKVKEATTIKKEIDNQAVPFLKDYYLTKYHTIMNYCINISYFLYLRATSPTNCKGHPVVKRILQYRRLLDELNTFSPKKHLQSLQQHKRNKPKKTKRHSSTSQFNVNSSKSFLEASDDEPIGLGLEQPMEEKIREKRGINYTIAKNKGLTPYRKKELRNPRVKHRVKFQKATVRRKGQVRNARKEIRKYEGELTGIKMNVTKSIKFK